MLRTTCSSIASPSCGLVRRWFSTHTTSHPRRLHFQLFQDVYERAGDLRTVGVAKGEGSDTSFMPPFEIERPVAHVAERIAASDRLRTTSPSDLVGELAYLYDYLNFAHPFRDGSGRTQREFFTQLLAESEHGLAWERIEMVTLHEACHRARTAGDVAGLVAVFGLILTDQANY